MPNNSTKESINIDHLRIATPCPISWEQMTGDHRIRFCGHCQLNVYNISELSRIEAESLIASAEGRVCAKLYRRVDGTILTKDCPVGLRALRMRVSKRAAAIFAAIASLSPAAFGQQSTRDGKTVCTPQAKITRTTDANRVANVLAGNVVDPNSAVIPGAKVTLTNVKTKAKKSTLTDDAGRFEFASLAAGDYSVIIEFTGFKSLQIKSIIVEKDKLISLDTILEPSGATETMGVVEYAGPLESPPGTPIMSGDLIRKLPIQ
jgi:hypothetical protein